MTMDNTELHFVTYDPDEIYSALVSVYMENGGTALKPGMEVDCLIRGMVAAMTQAFAGVDNALRMQTLRYAVGSYLDLIGENRGCERMKAIAATGTATFTFAENIEGQSIPTGTLLTVDGSVLWRTMDDAYMGAKSGGGKTALVRIECVTEGAIGNGVAARTDLQMIVPNDNVVTVKVTTATSGGRDAEDDESYRERIRMHGLASVTTGTKPQYEGIAKEIDGVKDAQAYYVNYNTQVRVAVLAKSGYTTSTVIEDVKSVILSDSVMPLGVKADVIAAEPEQAHRQMNLTVTIPADADTSARNACEEVIASYIEWQAGKIGRAFTPGMLVGGLYAAGASNVVLTEGGTAVSLSPEAAQNGHYYDVHLNVTWN